MIPARGLCYVRPIKTAETLAGGKIILTENVREQWTGQQVEIVAVGYPAFCDDEECERPHQAILGFPFPLPGEPRLHAFTGKSSDWVLVTARSYVEIADHLWVVPQDEVLAVIEDCCLRSRPSGAS